MPSRFVTTLGIGQCVNWGVLYYAFAVLLVPVERDLGLPRWAVAGAFSLSLVTSAAFAPAVGRWIDRGHGPAVMRIGGYMAAALLTVWALAPTAGTLYLVWAGLGMCMAAVLYEPAFVIVGRAFDDPADRLRALAAVTVFGGLASTVFLPLTAFLVRAFDWRGAVGALAFVLAASTCLVSRFGFRQTVRTEFSKVAEPAPARLDRSGEPRPGFVSLLVVFSAASLASAAFTTNLIPALGERDVPVQSAAMLGGLLGVMQLPGRALLMHGSIGASPGRLLLVCFLLQAAGLLTLALARPLPVIAIAIALFAAGAGLATLARPHLVQTMFGIAQAGRLNGRLARSQQLARAAGPVVAAWIAAAAGYSFMFLLLAVVFAVIALILPGTLSSFVPSLAPERNRHEQPTSATIVQ
jgi:MFS family permease